MLAGLDQRPGQSGQGNRRERRTQPVDTGDRCAIAALRNVANRHGNHGERQRQVDQENQTPRPDLDEPPADERPDGSGNPGKARPRTHCPPPVAGRERCLKDRQAARCQERTANPLEGAGGRQGIGCRSHAAQQRCGREPDDTDHKHPTTAEAVAQGAADQDQ